MQYSSIITLGKRKITRETFILKAVAKNLLFKSIEKDLRPISLTCLLCKELERFVVKWIRDYIKDQIDQNQF